MSDSFYAIWKDESDSESDDEKGEEGADGIIEEMCTTHIQWSDKANGTIDSLLGLLKTDLFKDDATSDRTMDDVTDTLTLETARGSAWERFSLFLTNLSRIANAEGHEEQDVSDLCEVANLTFQLKVLAMKMKVLKAGEELGELSVL
tara:strand:+ start:2574 stop:3014 length:441 start_codon:yes stop_codon:yes gene_type:complete